MKTGNPKKEISKFGRWLRAEIRSRGMTQAAFAKKIGVSDTSVSRWVNGDKPKAEHIDAIADVLVLDFDFVFTMAGIRPAELMMEVDPMSPEGQLLPFIREIDWGKDDRLEKMKHDLQWWINADRGG